jgi:hypothetical protein
MPCQSLEPQEDEPPSLLPLSGLGLGAGDGAGAGHAAVSSPHDPDALAPLYEPPPPLVKASTGGVGAGAAPLGAVAARYTLVTSVLLGAGSSIGRAL